MHQLYLVRHAKSDWGSEFLKDIDRPLNERGYTDAYFMSKWFMKNKKMPDVILSSTATRALNTALIFARAFEFNMNRFFLDAGVYECPSQKLISIIKQQDDEFKSLMVFCHNPCITDVSNKLTDDVFIDNVPTCGIINLNFEINSWKEIETKKANMGFFQFPKDFKNNG